MGLFLIFKKKKKKKKKKEKKKYHTPAWCRCSIGRRCGQQPIRTDLARMQPKRTRRREGGTADHDRDLGAELLDRDFGYAPTFGFGLRDLFAGGSVYQDAMGTPGS